MNKLNLKKITLGTSLLSLSFIATADHWCMRCNRMHGAMCPADPAAIDPAVENASEHLRARYFWGNHLWRNLAELLEAEEKLQHIIETIGDWCTSYSVALAVKDILIGNAALHGYGWGTQNLPTKGTPSLVGSEYTAARARVFGDINQCIRSPQQALDLDWAIAEAVDPAGSGPLAGRFGWTWQCPLRVIAGCRAFGKPMDWHLPAWDIFQKEPELITSPEDSDKDFFLQRQYYRSTLTKEWYESHGLADGLDYCFIRLIGFNITNQRRADEVNTVLCLIAERYGFPWVNRNRRIENFNLENAELPSFLDHLFAGIVTEKDLLKVDNAMKAESIRGGRFVWHAQGDAAAAQADQ